MKKGFKKTAFISFFILVFIAMIFSFFVPKPHNNYDWYYDKMNLSALKKSGNTVAIIDSGYKSNSGFNESNIILKYNVINDTDDVNDEYGHGTALLSLLIGFNDGNNHVNGINPNAKVIIIKAMNNQGKTTGSNLKKAIIFAVDNGANIINISMGTKKNNDEVYEGIKYALDNKVYIVSSVGDNQDDSIMFPATYNGVISVEAQSQNGNRYILSNISNKTTVRVPGVNVKVYSYDSVNDMWKTYCENGSSIASIIFSAILSTYELSEINLNYQYFEKCMENNVFIDVKNIILEDKK